MKFSKYHALGNDYIVIDPKNLSGELSETDIRAICNRHFGVGSDGILCGPNESDSCDFSLKIFNPDASEAEKSGNGLRIFSRYLWDQSLVSYDEFTIETKGGVVNSIVGKDGLTVSVGMGKVRFTHESNLESEPIPEIIKIKNREFTYYLANVGNPHCVILLDDVTPSLAKEYGSIIENDTRFLNRTNVQFVKVIDKSSIQIEIWERGAGYTLASGSSSTAAASVVHALGLCKSTIDVHMPGGVIGIELDSAFFATMTGAVRKICEGEISSEVLNLL
ncbi:diaminopimelate epimerase [Marinomonas mediterranea]|jgi:diaminopimelate epimerase (EC 5.1.1.7)|uniref:Diaminopimelate epimerase n=1 Tax=Marinomonas mediterranea (strain ATCC 700492 / JCM 21426 / NBRC 103028 / MMB-1) TaxID=717774 RepID=F2JZT0_MARM1|nr:diaminopimelate epimerase [Marinomonas mediterranea]ADZ90934.1 Diaminopimelate epimerase [Marinomonas mediterranea MMB-1]WCN13005.1 diaminopimelate epimerase [Marinomonas mediterranea]WCN17078.1 diaminopimelate epimerase [Marinomonas mediterranea MMB-1]